MALSQILFFLPTRSLLTENKTLLFVVQDFLSLSHSRRERSGDLTGNKVETNITRHTHHSTANPYHQLKSDYVSIKHLDFIWVFLLGFIY